ncbi:hypothetical protein Z043_110141 [Scleropages formosus]|uniref:BMERB domain-containing protein n=1 Tax=Scleropages formosus TaxID=113540 RepID=A0A0P7V7V2_SCLFO|nr:hypothetical protein Z043_110141 [Scleropages formosus]
MRAPSLCGIEVQDGNIAGELLLSPDTGKRTVTCPPENTSADLMKAWWFSHPLLCGLFRGSIPRLCGLNSEGEEDVLMDDLMVDWFTLIRNKQVYMRRESELVYIAKTQDLEEQQPGVEQELRRLIEKPEHLKTLADRKREQELMEKLVEIVNDRNAIVEGLDEDRLRTWYRNGTVSVKIFGSVDE